MKMDFPFEHVLLDCIAFVGLTFDSQHFSVVQASIEGENISSSANERAAEVEKLFQTFLAIPIPDVREPPYSAEGLPCRMIPRYQDDVLTGFRGTCGMANR